MSTRRSILLALAGLTVPAAAEAATPPKKKIPARKRLIITINKVSQKMTVELDGRSKYRWPVSTGAPGYETPSGKYRPFRMEREHFSKEWDDAPMPHSIFFTGRGHAVHGSYHVKSLGRRASHGCVRLHPDNAAKLFALVQQTGMANTSVIVRGGFFDGGFDNEGPDKIGKLFAREGRKAKRKLFPWMERN